MNKAGKSITDAFQHIVQISNRKHDMLWVDQGIEFYNQTFDNWLQDNNIEIYSTYNEGKAIVIERFNTTLKGRMWKYFSAKNTNVYLSLY